MQASSQDRAEALSASDRSSSTLPWRGAAYAGVFCILGVLTFSPARTEARPYEAIKGESSLTYVLHHPMHLVKGVNRDFECKVELSDDTVSSVIRVTAKVRDFDSGNSSRDSHALEAVEGLKFPTVVFASRTVRRDSAGYAVAGDLTFHGVTRPVELHVVPGEAKDRITIKGAFTIKLSDYGVKRPSVMFVKSKDELTLRFDLAAKP